ncbi:3-isopropylmalate dehydratase small subunit [Caulobacter segnis]|uniref:3-isopropylmalate dehydratase n=1 Tax=Caulobacter segnis TaxID=88688 RepID=A0A2W5VDX7_9CAUL|nr:3-isopropylmalate dehydratase small subunit [Caulobacter segnis]PZR36083.1 MAG: 3-isopropylmalate dehydratase small subunit [Caulobacter segnis]
MDKIEVVEGPIARLPAANVDTDIIYPARFLLITTRDGLGKLAFHDKQDAPDYAPMFAALASGAPILVAGPNFGCGSSREQAVWALKEAGVKVVIAPSFGEIFQSNCAKNGVLAIRMDEAEGLPYGLESGALLQVDLRAQTLAVADGVAAPFSVNPAVREALLNGWDDIARIKALHRADIEAFEARRRVAEPWLFPGDHP